MRVCKIDFQFNFSECNCNLMHTSIWLSACMHSNSISVDPILYIIANISEWVSYCNIEYGVYIDSNATVESFTVWSSGFGHLTYIHNFVFGNGSLPEWDDGNYSNYWLIIIVAVIKYLCRKSWYSVHQICQCFVSVRKCNKRHFQLLSIFQVSKLRKLFSIHIGSHDLLDVCFSLIAWR